METKRKLNFRADLQGIKLLLVEDTKINQVLVCGILKNQAIEMTIANNGREAMEIISQNSFDLVLLDIQMPEMNGYQTIKAIRQDQRYAKLPVIAMTANAMSDDKEKCLKAGMNDYISKPINPALFLDKLISWVGLKNDNPEIFIADDFVTDEKKNEQLLQTLSGIDSDLGLYLANQNQALYITLLKQFALEYHDLVNDLEQAMSSNLNEGHQFIHRIKGVSGHLGMTELFEISKKIETQLRVSYPDKALLNQFSFIVAKILSSLMALEMLDSVTEQTSYSKIGNGINREKITFLLDELEQQINAKNFRAKQLMSKIYSLLNPLKPEPLDALLEAIRLFAWKQAGIHCQQLRYWLDNNHSKGEIIQ